MGQLTELQAARERDTAALQVRGWGVWGSLSFPVSHHLNFLLPACLCFSGCAPPGPFQAGVSRTRPAHAARARESLGWCVPCALSAWRAQATLRRVRRTPATHPALHITRACMGLIVSCHRHPLNCCTPMADRRRRGWTACWLRARRRRRGCRGSWLRRVRPWRRWTRSSHRCGCGGCWVLFRPPFCW